MSVVNNFYELLGVEQVYLLDNEQLLTLKKHARNLQRQYHPDRLQSATPKEQQLAAQFSAQINSAVQTLRDPVARAKHLLELLGFAAPDEQYTVRDTAFLMQQMAYRESLEEASFERDLAGLDDLSEQIAVQFSLVQNRFAELADKLVQQRAVDQDTASQETGEKAGELVAEMHFFQKLSTEIDSARAVIG